MSSIEKMSIRGIRSFSPDREQVLAFYKPLTVIIGPNGCGKTTTIECLKYATTGLLPPNSKSGQAFIHDPKISGQTEVKACIKLAFKNKAGTDMVCNRLSRLTQRRAKLEFKVCVCVCGGVDWGWMGGV